MDTLSFTLTFKLLAMTQSEKTKAMIIENWFLHEHRRELNQMEKKWIAQYVEEDHYNEILITMGVHEDELGLHTICQNCGSSTNL